MAIPLRLLLAGQPQLLTLIQRFGSAANLNIHLHCLVLDGVYRPAEGGPVFVEAQAPTAEALPAMLHKIIRRILKLLTRRGCLVEEGDTSYLADFDADGDSDRTLKPVASCRMHLSHRLRTAGGAEGAESARRAASGGTASATALRASTEPACTNPGSAPMSWARLLKRVFEIDLEHCPNCGGELKIIASIIEAPVIERILTHLGLAARAAPRSPARLPSLLQAA